MVGRIDRKMIYAMIICSIILLLCIASSKLLYRFGIPTLAIFIILGMLFGSDGIVGIYFSDYELSRQICSFGLVFIMFYGGFGTNWKAGKPVFIPALLMSTLGVIITASLTGMFCYFVLKTSLLEGLLIGSVVASTDAASVFAILRSRKLNLKDGLGSLLEIESGSNDPISYMLTVIIVSLMLGNGEASVLSMLFSQIVFGLLIGFILAKITVITLQKINLEIDGLYPILVTAIVILGYALSETVGGNGYICVYLIGIIVGNSNILNKRSLFHFFDGISWIMQIMLFFTLGLLSFPSEIPKIIAPAVIVSIFMIFVARPIATFSILSWFKFPIMHQLFVSWVGLRGAASVVFAIYAVSFNINLNQDIFHIVFFVALFSVLVQGTLIPTFARKLDLVDDNESIFKTFTDYEEESLTHLMEVEITKSSPWVNKTLSEANIPQSILVVMIKRNKKAIVPKGSTKIKLGDVLVLNGIDFDKIPV